MYIYGWDLSLFTWNYHNIVNRPQYKMFLVLKNFLNVEKVNDF